MSLSVRLILALVRTHRTGIATLQSVAAELDPSVQSEFLAALSTVAGFLFKAREVGLGEDVLRIMNGVRVGS